MLACLLLTSTLLGSTSLPPGSPPAVAQSQSSSDLFYTFYGQQIPLNLRQNTIAVSFRANSGRGSRTPLYQQLQQDLTGGRAEGSSRGSDRRTSAAPTEIKV